MCVFSIGGASEIVIFIQALYCFVEAELFVKIVKIVKLCMIMLSQSRLVCCPAPLSFL